MILLLRYFCILREFLNSFIHLFEWFEYEIKSLLFEIKSKWAPAFECMNEMGVFLCPFSITLYLF